MYIQRVGDESRWSTLTRFNKNLRYAIPTIIGLAAAMNPLGPDGASAALPIGLACIVQVQSAASYVRVGYRFWRNTEIAGIVKGSGERWKGVRFVTKGIGDPGVESD